MSKKASTPPADKLELYEKLIRTNPDIQKKGASTAYTSCNGHMFTYLSKEGEMGIRLPKKERESFLVEFNTTLLHQYGSVMKEYVKIPDDMMDKTDLLKKYLDISYTYVKSLKPK